MLLPLLLVVFVSLVLAARPPTISLDQQVRYSPEVFVSVAAPAVTPTASPKPSYVYYDDYEPYVTPVPLTLPSAASVKVHYFEPQLVDEGPARPFDPFPKPAQVIEDFVDQRVLSHIVKPYVVAESLHTTLLVPSAPLPPLPSRVRP